MKKIIFAIAFMAAALTVALSGCGSTAVDKAVHPTTATAVIMLNGYNMPVVNNASDFVDAPQDGDETFIVVPDSTPSVTTLTWSTVANNPTYAQSESRKWQAELSDELSAVRPDSEGCDLLSAIHLAGTSCSPPTHRRTSSSYSVPELILAPSILQIRLFGLRILTK